MKKPIKKPAKRPAKKAERKDQSQIALSVVEKAIGGKLTVKSKTGGRIGRGVA